MTIPTETQEKAKRVIWKKLDSHFKGKVRFSEIRASAMLDQDDNDFLNVLVVYEGDRKGLEPRLCNSLYSEIRGRLLDAGLHTIPSISYVDRIDDAKRTDMASVKGPSAQR